MIRIRLAYSTKNKHSCSYAIVAADVRSPRDGAFLEKVGHYHAYMSDTDPARCVIDLSKVDSWINKGAALTDRVAALIRKNIHICDHTPSTRLTNLLKDYEAKIEHRKEVLSAAKA